MQLGLSESLSSLVSRRFSAAKDAGHLTFSSTYLSIIHSSGIPFQLRYCPALAKKPTGAPKPDGARPAPKPDPFQDPSPDLLLAQFPHDNPAYTLVLNKFPVIQSHFILATKDWKPQTDVLEKGDLDAAYACVKAWGENNSGQGSNGNNNGKRLFAFFNSGNESGASQPHRHLQFLPVESMRQDDVSGGWEPLVDRLLGEQGVDSYNGLRQVKELPFAHFAAPIPPNPTAETLHAMYLSLYRAAVKAVNGENSNGGSTTDGNTAPTDGPAVISYNLGLTESTMMICPRRRESAQIPVGPVDIDNIADPGIVSLNGTILAGTLMVKAEAEWNELRNNQEHLTNVLATIGYAPLDSREARSL